MNNIQNDDISNETTSEVKEYYKLREKKHKKTIVLLSVACLVLAVCLVISICLSTKKGVDEDSDTSSSDVPTSKNEEYLGEMSGDKLGEYKVVSGYGEIYDYVKEKYRTRDFGYGTYELLNEVDSIKLENSVEDVAGAVSNDTGHSTTNIMTDNVDESDISITDGKYIYNATESEIIIFEIQEEKAVEYARFTPDFLAPSDVIREIYVDKDTLSIITEHTDFNAEKEKEQTLVLTYDIKNRKDEKLLGKYKQDGTFYTVRKVDDILYVFTEKFINEPINKKEKAISGKAITEWFPSVNDMIISPDCIYMSNSGLNTLLISSFSQKNPADTIDVKAIINDYSKIYVGNNAIYLYSQTYSGNREILKLSKLFYKDGLIKTGNSTSIRGQLNDDFAINEYQDYLRVVATERTNGTSNTLYVFDKNLQECGRINNIARGEELYACRFMGDIGYFVTFEQTDPLFSVDLKDPKNPKIIGELTLPGFSEYLHFWGEDKLIGFGYDADMDGNRNGLKLSMFDISNPSNVIEESNEKISGDYAPGFNNYKAILAYAKGNVFGFAYNDYSRDECYYDFYEYKDGKFNRIIEEKIDSDLVHRARGHVANGYLFISKDSEVYGVGK